MFRFADDPTSLSTTGLWDPFPLSSSIPHTSRSTLCTIIADRSVAIRLTLRGLHFGQGLASLGGCCRERREWRNQLLGKDGHRWCGKSEACG